MNIGPKTSSSLTPASSPPTPRIDAHHHLWLYHPADFSWIDDDMAALRRNFLINDLSRELQAAHIDATVAVQARESLEETRWLLECAQSTPFIRGVVGWAPLEAADLPDVLSRFNNAQTLVGFREIAQGKPDGFLDR